MLQSSGVPCALAHRQARCEALQGGSGPTPLRICVAHAVVHVAGEGDPYPEKRLAYSVFANDATDQRRIISRPRWGSSLMSERLSHHQPRFGNVKEDSMRGRKSVLYVVTAALTVALQSAVWAAPDPNPDPSKPGFGPPTGRTEHTSCKGFGEAVSSEAQEPGPYGELVREGAQDDFGQNQLE